MDKKCCQKIFAADDGVAWRIKKLFNSRLPDSTVRGVEFWLGISQEFEAKIETARKLVWGTYADLKYANYAGRCFSFFSSSGTTYSV